LSFIEFASVAQNARTETSSASRLNLARLESSIEAQTFPKLTSLIVSQEGRLLYEKYFGEGNSERLNNTRSATKSLTALIVGRALQDGVIEGVDMKVLRLFSDLPSTAKVDPIKEDIRLKDLLTMSSAFAADDSDHRSPGNEDRMHEQNNWTEWGLGLPIRPDYGRNSAGFGPFHYATINAVLLGQCVERATHRAIDAYIVETLFAPLGISQYKFQKSPAGEIMTGGGLELRSIDLWRLGQLLADEGRYEGKQIIPTSWVNECLTVRQTDTGRAGVQYGFLFWHTNFNVGNRLESGWYIAGNSGNLVLVVPSIKAVIVVTRTAYNLPTAAKETFEIVSNFILPSLKEAATH